MITNSKKDYDLSKMTILPRARFDPARRIVNNVIVLESDVVKIFSDDQAVNEALRLILKAGKRSQAVPANRV
jgi:hypothetical protein